MTNFANSFLKNGRSGVHRDSMWSNSSWSLLSCGKITISEKVWSILHASSCTQGAFWPPHILTRGIRSIMYNKRFVFNTWRSKTSLPCHSRFLGRNWRCPLQRSVGRLHSLLCTCYRSVVDHPHRSDNPNTKRAILLPSSRLPPVEGIQEWEWQRRRKEWRVYSGRQ